MESESGLEGMKRRVRFRLVGVGGLLVRGLFVVSGGFGDGRVRTLSRRTFLGRLLAWAARWQRVLAMLLRDEVWDGSLSIWQGTCISAGEEMERVKKSLCGILVEWQ